MLLSVAGCQRRSGGDKAYTGGDQSDAQPSCRRNHFMQSKVADESDEDIGKRRGGQHVGEVSPGQRRHITSEKCEQEENAEGHPRIQDREQESREIMQ